MSETIFLMGFMGSGKSAVARSLAARLRRPFVDLDARIEREAGKKITQLFADEGEAAFRKLEARHLQEVAREGGIVSLGGGVPTIEANRQILRDAIEKGAAVVYLQTSAPELARRIRLAPGKRPLIDGEGELSLEATQKRVEELLAARESLYCECASLVVTTDGKTIPEIARSIALHGKND